MTGLEDAASGGSEYDILLPSDLDDAGELRFDSWADYDCDELTPEGDFPIHGDQFFEVSRRDGDGGWDEEEETFALIPGQLASMILEKVEEAGGTEEVEAWRTSFEVTFAGKSDGGRWQFIADVDVTDT